MPKPKKKNITQGKSGAGVDYDVKVHYDAENGSVCCITEDRKNDRIRRRFEYTPNGNLSEIKVYGDKIMPQYKFQYDTKGRVTWAYGNGLSISYRKDGTIDRIKRRGRKNDVIKYSENNQPVLSLKDRLIGRSVEIAIATRYAISAKKVAEDARRLVVTKYQSLVQEHALSPEEYKKHQAKEAARLARCKAFEAKNGVTMSHGWTIR